MILAVATLLDMIALYSGEAVIAERILPEKFSNSDPNQVILKLRNNYRFSITAEVIDEEPQSTSGFDFLVFSLGEPWLIIFSLFANSR